MLLQLLLRPHLTTTDRPAPKVRVRYGDQVVFNGTIVDQINIMQQIFEDGDLIMTGTPGGVGPIEVGDRFSGKVFEEDELVAEGNWVVI